MLIIVPCTTVEDIYVERHCTCGCILTSQASWQAFRSVYIGRGGGGGGVGTTEVFVQLVAQSRANWNGWGAVIVLCKCVTVCSPSHAWVR